MPAATSTLTTADLAMFERLRVPTAMLDGRVVRVTDAEARTTYGVQYRGDLDGLAYLYITPDGRHVNTRVRRDNPDVEDGRPKNKYISAYMDHRRLYYPPDCAGMIETPSIPVVIVEAEKSALALAALFGRIGRRVLVLGAGGCYGWSGRIGKATSPNGARVDEYGLLPDFDHITWIGREVIILFDANAADNPNVQRAERALSKKLTRRGARVKVARLPIENGVNGPDDYIAAHADEELLGIIDASAAAPSLRVVTIAGIMEMEFPPREQILDPILPTQGTVMVYSKRGVGKTHLSLGIGCAVAAGCKILRWAAPRPRRVLYLDGEMPAVTMRERLALIVAGMDVEPDPDYFRLITPDLQERGMPSLSHRDGQAMIEDHLDDIELVILDNLSTLCRGGKENEAESWLPVQEWVLSLRRRGISALLVHHAGKSGAQRGTSRREDVLDTVIALRHPADYEPSQGARFEIEIEKARNVHGDQLNPFEATMETRDGAAVWLIREIEDVRESRAREMFGDGMSIRDVAEELRISKSQAGRLKKKVGGAL